jgi:hypothetical protein
MGEYGTARQATDHNITRRMYIACWMNKATGTHSEYVIFIAFSRQQWLGESALMLRLYYIVCLVLFVLPHSQRRIETDGVPENLCTGDSFRSVYINDRIILK